MTLAAPGPWLVALSFAMYSGQWLAVIGFLPSIYVQSGIAGAAAGVLTAAVAAANMVGNIGSGRLLQRGVAPSRLLAIGFVDDGPGRDGHLRRQRRCRPGAGAALRGGAAVLGRRRADPGDACSRWRCGWRRAKARWRRRVGWVQQWSALGQFAGPPLVAAVASAAGGWQWTWVVTGACSVAGLLLTVGLSRLPAQR